MREEKTNINQLKINIQSILEFKLDGKKNKIIMAGNHFQQDFNIDNNPYVIIYNAYAIDPKNQTTNSENAKKKVVENMIIKKGDKVNIFSLTFNFKNLHVENFIFKPTGDNVKYINGFKIEPAINQREFTMETNFYEVTKILTKNADD
jgi:uncharacterized protein YciI